MFKPFKGKSSTNIGTLKVAFYMDATAHGSHGQIRVSHRRLGLVERAVYFVFVGLSTAPELTPQLLEHIWSQAYEQGYVPHALVGCLDDNVQSAPTQQLGSALREIGYSYDALIPTLLGETTGTKASPFADTPAVMRRRTDRENANHEEVPQ